MKNETNSSKKKHRGTRADKVLYTLSIRLQRRQSLGINCDSALFMCVEYVKNWQFSLKHFGCL